MSSTPATNLLADPKKALTRYAVLRRRKPRNVIAGRAALDHLGGLVTAEDTTGDDTALMRIFGARLNASVNDFAVTSTDLRVAILGSDDIVNFESPLAQFRFDEQAGPALVTAALWGLPRDRGRSSAAQLDPVHVGGKMPKAMMVIGNANAGAPTPATAEDAAFEYFMNRVGAGNFAPKPPVERWRADQRERFEKELERLEART